MSTKCTECGRVHGLTGMCRSCRGKRAQTPEAKALRREAKADLVEWRHLFPWNLPRLNSNNTRPAG